MSESTIELLKSLDEDALKDLIRTCALIADPLSQELMKKAASEGVEACYTCDRAMNILN